MFNQYSVTLFDDQRRVNRVIGQSRISTWSHWSKPNFFDTR